MIENQKAVVTVAPSWLNGNPDALAMLQAYYSRSHKPISDRLAEMQSDDEMGGIQQVLDSLSKFYIGYGHESIGNCGTVTVFIEGVSMILAKFLQNHPLYNGQEASSRYIPFEAEGRYIPYGDDKAWAITQGWIGLYLKVKESVYPKLFKHALQSLGDDAKEDEAKRVAKAAMFDLARGWLPSNCRTQLSVTCHFSALNDIIGMLLHSDMPEFEEVGKQMHTLLSAAYPEAIKVFTEADASFYRSRMLAYSGEANDWYKNLRESASRIESCSSSTLLLDENCILQYTPNLSSGLVNLGLDTLCSALSNESRLPLQSLRELDLLGTVRLYSELDFGGYRDIQRHRSGMRPLSVFGLKVKDVGFEGVHPWYVQQLEQWCDDPEVVEALKEETQLQLQAVRDFDGFLDLGVFPEVFNRQQGWRPDDPEYLRAAGWYNRQKQYLCPLMTLVPVHMEFGLGSFIYTMHLREQNTVHPTVRALAQSSLRLVLDDLKRRYPKQLKNLVSVTVNPNRELISAKRANQTIFDGSGKAISD